MVPLSTYEPNCCCPFNNPEAVGYVMVSSLPVGTTAMSFGVFFAAAVIELANREVGCGYLYADDIEDDDEIPTCKGTYGGLRPAAICRL
jgi:hypothetical protein